MDGFRVVRRQTPHRWIGLVVLPVALLFHQSTLSMLQTLSICAAFPIMIIVCVIIAGFLKSLREDSRKNKLPGGPPPEPAPAGKTDAE